MDRVYFDLTALGVNTVYEELIKSAKNINANPQRPLFILLEQINMFDEKEVPKISAIEFSKENIDNLFDMLRNPEKAWEIYNNSTSNIKSDVVQRISVRKNKDPAEQEDYPDVWLTRKIGLFDSNKDEESKERFEGTVFEDFLKEIPPFTTFQRHKNGFFNAKFNSRYTKLENSYPEKEKVFYRYWTEIKNNLQKRKEFCLEKQFIDPILSYDEKKELHEIPCVIYALKQANVSQRIIDDLYRFYVCYGNIIKTKDLHTVLTLNKIRLRISKVSFPTNAKFKITSNEYPNRRTEENKNWPIIWLDFYRGHIMLHEDVYLEGSHVKTPFLRLLEWAFEEKFLVYMNAFEFCELSCNNGFALNYKLNTKELLEGVDECNVFENDCIPFHAKKLQSTKLIVYADFECSVDEQYHRPYCISYRTIPTITNGREKVDEKGHFWGEDCGERFLELLRSLVDRINNDEIDKEMSLDDRTFRFPWRNPACTVYFHNLRYDFTFLMKYLKDMKITKKGNTLYSVKGVFGKGKHKICFLFKDTLPLLQMSLRNAGKSFLSEKQQKKVKKEAFPYELYTYSFFDTHPSGWCTLEEFRAGFNNDELLNDFDENLPNLPISIYDPQSQHIFYKEYAFFYCDQDVRVLYHVMNKFERLLTATGNVEGINGAPPFGHQQNPFLHLTISSLSYDYFQRKAILEYKQTGTTRLGPKMEWVPKYPIMMTRGLLRYIGHKTIRGGRVMTRDNTKWHYVADPNNPDSILVDYDGVSLYPSAISRLWLTEGIPILIKGGFSEKEFLEKFTHPDAPEGEFKQYNDGWIHVYSLMCWKDRHFPSLCVKDEKTKLNEYQNFHGAIDTWINAIDLFNLIEFQNATFCWDAAVVWEGPRHYECRTIIKELFEFRARNKQHPIQLVTKLMMNSIYGKSALKPAHFEEEIIDAVKWRKLGEEENIQWEKVDNWRKTFNADAYRIKSFDFLDKEHISVKFHQLDTSANFVPFGSNVLAMARRIIMRVMSLAEDMEELHPECAPGLFYTDTDSMHIRKDLLKYTEAAYLEKYGEPICGKNLCQFHIDFDPPKNFKKGEEVVGANESWFIMKKMYADQLIGTEGSIAYHQRMKGVPSDLVHWEDYEKIYNDEFVEFNLLENGHVSFFYENGKVGSRKQMKRQIATREARNQLKEDLDVVNNLVAALKEAEKARTPKLAPEVMEIPPYQPPEWAEWMEGDTQPLDIIEDEETQLTPAQKRDRGEDEINIESDDEMEAPALKLPKIDE